MTMDIAIPISLAMSKAFSLSVSENDGETVVTAYARSCKTLFAQNARSEESTPAEKAMMHESNDLNQLSSSLKIDAAWSV